MFSSVDLANLLKALREVSFFATHVLKSVPQGRSQVRKPPFFRVDSGFGKTQVVVL
jgi:hypothetical protein